jgi:hypothetical protein
MEIGLGRAKPNSARRAGPAGARVDGVTRRGPWSATPAPVNALRHRGAPSRASAYGVTE